MYLAEFFPLDLSVYLPYWYRKNSFFLFSPNYLLLAYVVSQIGDSTINDELMLVFKNIWENAFFLRLLITDIILEVV